MVGPQQISFGEDALRFSLPRTLYFPLLSFNECSLFLELRLAFVFHLDFCSDVSGSKSATTKSANPKPDALHHANYCGSYIKNLRHRFNYCDS
jgi:hypothetical protein